MKKIILFLPIVFFIANLSAQSITQDVIATSGDSFSNAAGMLSFTTGEPMSESFSAGSNIISQGFQQPPLTYWVGAVSTAWENALNWNPSVLPDGNADVIILLSMPRYPIINSNPFCATITNQTGTTLTVNSTYTLTIKGH